jgi:hypothetical protein
MQAGGNRGPGGLVDPAHHRRIERSDIMGAISPRFATSVSTSDARAVEDRPTGGGLAFLWIVLLANLAWFSAFAVSTGAGILRAVRTPTAPPPGYVPVGSGGVQMLLIDVGGVALLGLALAYGLYRYHTRDRRLDPVAEEAARDVYDKPAPAGQDG